MVLRIDVADCINIVVCIKEKEPRRNIVRKRKKRCDFSRGKNVILVGTLFQRNSWQKCKSKLVMEKHVSDSISTIFFPLYLSFFWSNLAIGSAYMPAKESVMFEMLSLLLKGKCEPLIDLINDSNLRN